MNQEWENKKESFEVIDVRKMAENFLPMILKKADKITVRAGICVIQSFEPIPLYSALTLICILGFSCFKMQKMIFNINSA